MDEWQQVEDKPLTQKELHEGAYNRYPKRFSNQHSELQPNYVTIGPHDGAPYVTLNHGSVAVCYNDRPIRVVQLVNRESSNLQGIAVMSEKIMFVADASRHEIIKASLDGAVIDTVGKEGHGEREFNQPMGICLSKDDKFLFVAECNNRRIQVLKSADLSFFGFIPCGSRVKGVAFDGTNVHAACENDGVKVFGIDGNPVTSYGQDKVFAGDIALFSHGQQNLYSFVTDNIGIGRNAGSNDSAVYVFKLSRNDNHYQVIPDAIEGFRCGFFPLGIALSDDQFAFVCVQNHKQLIRNRIAGLIT